MLPGLGDGLRTMKGTAYNCNEPGLGTITYSGTTVHWGVGTEFSVADKGAHTQIRLIFKYSGAGAMVARTYNVATGASIKQLFNSAATAEGKVETAVLDLPAGVENIRLTTLALKNAGSITIVSKANVASEI